MDYAITTGDETITLLGENQMSVAQEGGSSGNLNPRQMIFTLISQEVRQALMTQIHKYNEQLVYLNNL